MKGSRRTRFTVGLVILALGGALTLPIGQATAATPGGGTVYVLQGLRTVTADVTVDGAKVATGVSATTVVGPLRLAAGRHVVAFTSKGASLASASVNVTKGASLDVLGYWAAETRK